MFYFFRTTVKLRETESVVQTFHNYIFKTNVLLKNWYIKICRCIMSIFFVPSTLYKFWKVKMLIIEYILHFYVAVVLKMRLFKKHIVIRDVKIWDRYISLDTSQSDVICQVCKVQLLLFKLFQQNISKLYMHICYKFIFKCVIRKFVKQSIYLYRNSILNYILLLIFEYAVWYTCLWYICTKVTAIKKHTFRFSISANVRTYWNAFANCFVLNISKCVSK